MNTTLKILKAARAYLTPPERWVQGSFVRYVDGSPGDGDEYRDSVVCACMSGAITMASASSAELAARIEAIQALAITIQPNADLQMACSSNAIIVGFNDRESTTHADVLRVYDQTIASLEARLTTPSVLS